mmetsp:Transcript_10256/g.18435  ORF Transcript_10256/g.18435 Transcript_10256/m.18435 type:complete len:89 (+) Transcript_10256:270-536(+)
MSQRHEEKRLSFSPPPDQSIATSQHHTPESSQSWQNPTPYYKADIHSSSSTISEYNPNETRARNSQMQYSIHYHSWEKDSPDIRCWVR